MKAPATLKKAFEIGENSLIRMRFRPGEKMGSIRAAK